MHAQQSREQTGTHFTNTEKKAHVTIDLNGKNDIMQPTRLKRTTSHLVPHLGGLVASIGTYSCAGAFTLAHACASAM